MRHISFLWGIPIYGNSAHYRFRPPDGLVIKDIEFDFKDEELTEEYNRKKMDYFDENYLHTHIPLEYYEKIKPKKKDKNEGDIENIIKIKFGIDFKSPILPLISLFWLFTLIPTIIVESLSTLLQYWALPGTIIVALSVYSINKPFLKYYLFSHVTFGFIVGFLIYILRILYLCYSAG